MSPPAFDGARCALLYRGPVRALVSMLKFDRRSDLARPLSRMMLSALPAEEAFDIVVPVPLHWMRRMQRGYNQAALLSRRIARALGVRHSGILAKRWRTADQTHLGAAARRANLRGSITIRDCRAAAWRARLPFPWSLPLLPSARTLQCARVLLVDDVITTGATSEACARALKRAGVSRVFVLALARTPMEAADEGRAGAGPVDGSVWPPANP